MGLPPRPQGRGDAWNPIIGQRLSACWGTIHRQWTTKTQSNSISSFSAFENSLGLENHITSAMSPKTRVICEANGSVTDSTATVILRLPNAAATDSETHSFMLQSYAGTWFCLLATVFRVQQSQHADGELKGRHCADRDHHLAPATRMRARRASRLLITPQTIRPP